MLSWKEKELLWMCWKQNSELNPYSECFSELIPILFEETKFSSGLGVEGLMSPYGSRAKPWSERPGDKAPGSSKDLVLWNHLFLVKIYPMQPVIKLIQHSFFQISCLNFSIQSYSSLTEEDPNLLPLCILFKIYILK